jgi:hypothetical protein
MRHLCFILCMIWLSGTSARSESVNFPSVFILSEGNTTCSEFTTQPEMQTIRLAWILGFISGINASFARSPQSAAAERMAGRSAQRTETITGWLQSYCAAHPLDPLVTAATQLRLDLIRHETGR